MERIQLEYIEPAPQPPGTAFDFGTAASDAGAPEPVIAYRYQEGTAPVLVTGHASARRAASAGRALAALVYPPDTPRLDLVRFALEDAGESATGVDRCLAVYKTLVFFQSGEPWVPEPDSRFTPERVPEELLELYSRFLGRSVSGRLVARLCRVAGYANEDLELMRRADLALEQIIPLLDLTARERRAVVRVRLATRFSVAETKKIAELLLFARARRDFDVDAWANALAGGNDTTNAVESLRKLVHPSLSRRQREMTSALRDAGLPPSVRIVTPESLEGSEFSAVMKFASPEQLSRSLAALQRAIEDGCVDRLFTILNREDGDEE